MFVENNSCKICLIYGRLLKIETLKICFIEIGNWKINVKSMCGLCYTIYYFKRICHRELFIDINYSYF